MHRHSSERIARGHDPFRYRPGRCRRPGHPTEIAGTRRLGDGQGRPDRRSGPAASLFARIQNQSFGLGKTGARDRSAARAGLPAVSFDRQQGGASRRRLRQGRRRDRRGRSGRARPRLRMRRGWLAQAWASLAQEVRLGNRKAEDRPVLNSPIGFGIGAVKCDTCSVNGGVRERSFSCTMPQVGVLPLRFSSRWRARSLLRFRSDGL